MSVLHLAGLVGCPHLYPLIQVDLSAASVVSAQCERSGESSNSAAAVVMKRSACEDRLKANPRMRYQEKNRWQFFLPILRSLSFQGGGMNYDLRNSLLSLP